MNSSGPFPEDPPEPKRGCLKLSDLIALAVLIIVLAALIPSICPPHGGIGRARRADCANHLSQLYKLGTTYAVAHRGRWPEAHGEDLWLFFAKCQPPLLDPNSLEILFCPVKGDEVVGDATDYRGPVSLMSKVRSGDPVGADKPGNHGHKYGGNVLRQDGGVQELEPDGAEWRRCEALLKP